MENIETYSIKYSFRPEDNVLTEYEVVINESDLTLVLNLKEKPEWTKLDENKCDVCPHNSSTSPHCPAALSLAQFIKDFSNEKSYKMCNVAVETPERTYFKYTSLQSGIYSIMGLILATSGCKVLGVLKPMARFHLPFATDEETIMRSLSFHLTRSYLNNPKKGTFDISELSTIYDKINKVNKGLLERIRSFSDRDANKNALVVLDAFASMLTFAIDDNFEDLVKRFPFD